MSALSSYQLSQLIADHTQLDADDVHDILLGNIATPQEDVDQVMNALSELLAGRLTNQKLATGAEQGTEQ